MPQMTNTENTHVMPYIINTGEMQTDEWTAWSSPYKPSKKMCVVLLNSEVHMAKMHTLANLERFAKSFQSDKLAGIRHVFCSLKTFEHLKYAHFCAACPSLVSHTLQTY